MTTLKDICANFYFTMWSLVKLIGSVLKHMWSLLKLIEIEIIFCGGCDDGRGLKN